MILQKQERAALAIARDILGREVTFERTPRCGVLRFGGHSLRIAANSHSYGTETQVRRWATQIRGK